MMFKVTIFIALAVVLVQSYVPISDEERRLQDDPRLGGVMDYLESAVNKAIDEGKEKLQSIGNTVSETMNSIVNKAKQVLNGNFQNLLDNSKAVKQRAKELDLDIKDCLNSREDYLMNLPKKYEAKIVQCGTDKINQAKQLIAEGVETLGYFTHLIPIFEKRWDECNGGWWCSYRLFAETIKGVIIAPGHIAEYAAKIIVDVEKLPADLEACGVRVGQDFVGEGNEIINHVEDCAMDKVLQD